jgi:hypothetical protein
VQDEALEVRHPKLNVSLSLIVVGVRVWDVNEQDTAQPSSVDPLQLLSIPSPHISEGSAGRVAGQNPAQL